ncbi:MAG: cadherin-like beta sandwich domain-containing protein [Spirochaetaceae bacterium]|jgi:hypothetical protein|nr:cadherin-like beta sandwich domain-containing protein [Spirochaetaceae bacterium]
MKQNKKLFGWALALAAAMSVLCFAACSDGAAVQILMEGEYPIIIAPTAQGEVLTDRLSADAYQAVTVWAKAGKKPVVVNDETGTAIILTPDSSSVSADITARLGGGEGVDAYSFIMPESGVTIKLESTVEDDEAWAKSVKITDVPANAQTDPYVFLNDGQPGPSKTPVSVVKDGGAADKLRVVVEKGSSKTLSYQIDAGIATAAVEDYFELDPPASGASFVLKVILTGGSESRTYPYEINNISGELVAKSADADLLSLKVGNIDFTFSAGTLVYDLKNSPVEHAVSEAAIVAVASHANAVITINGGNAQSGAEVAFYLTKTGLSEADANEATVLVTAEDGTTTKTYTVKVYRKKKSDASLKELIVDGATVSPAFSADTLAYDNTAAKLLFSTTNVGLTATPNDANATMALKIGSGASFDITGGEVNDVALENYGDTVNTASVIVTAEDGVATKTYTVTLYRNNPPPSSNAKLSSITVKTATGNVNVPLTPNFAGGTFAYSSAAPVENSVTSVNVFAAAADPASTVKINSVDADETGVTGTAFELKNTGATTNPNTVSILVTAANGGMESYTVKIYRKPSSDATLSSLTLTSPAVPFTFNSGTLSYDLKDAATQQLPNATTSVTVTAKTTQAGAKIKIGANSVASGVGSVVPLNVIGTAGNSIPVTVTAEDGTTTRTYTLKVYRKFSNDATLSSLSVNGGGLSVTGFTPSNLTYNLNLEASPLAFDVSSIKVRPTANNANATIKILSKTVVSGADYTWSFTGNGAAKTQLKLDIEVTAQDGTTKKTYAVQFWRERKMSNNTNITAITTTIGGKKDETSRVGPAASGKVTDYTIYMTDVTKAVSIGVTAEDVNATVFINPNNVVLKYTGTVSDWTALTLNPPVSITVTAEDKTTVKVYKITKLVRTPSALGKVPMAKGGTISFVGDDELHVFSESTQGKSLDDELAFLRDLPSADGWILVHGGGGAGGHAYETDLYFVSVHYSGGGGGGAGQVIEKKEYKWPANKLVYKVTGGAGSKAIDYYASGPDSGEDTKFDSITAARGTCGMDGEYFVWLNSEKTMILTISHDDDYVDNGKGGAAAGGTAYKVYYAHSRAYFETFGPGAIGGNGGYYNTGAFDDTYGGGGGGGAGGAGKDGEKCYAAGADGGAGGPGIKSSITGSEVEYGKGGQGGWSYSGGDHGKGGNSELITETDKDSLDYRQGGNGRVIVRFKWQAVK